MNTEKAPVADDPVRPYKMYVAIVLAMITALLSSETDLLPPVAELVLTVVAVGLGVYLTPNPKVEAL